MDIIDKAAGNIDMKGNLEKLRTFFLSYDPQPPIMDPDRFQDICKQVGVSSLFSTLHDATSTNRMSDEQQNLTKMRVVIVIYIMMYSQSQQANWFQVSLARKLKQFAISQQGLASLRNLGIVAHPQTIKASIVASSASHLKRVKEFFQSIIENEVYFFCIDNCYNIRTKHCPESKTQTQSVHTNTLLVKVFSNIKAVPNDSLLSLLPVHPAEESVLKTLIDEHMSTISQTYAMQAKCQTE